MVNGLIAFGSSPALWASKRSAPYFPQEGLRHLAAGRIARCKEKAHAVFP